MKPLEFEKDINPINAYQIFLDIENEIAEINEYDWQFSFGDESNLVAVIQDVIKKIDFYNIDTITRFGNPVFYWCGMFTLEPFDQLEMEEEDIANLIVKYHLKIDTSDGILIKFVNNSKSPLYRFFRKYNDGFGLNVPTSINTVLDRAEKWMKGYINDNMERFGEWEECLPVEEEQEEEVE